MEGSEAYNRLRERLGERRSVWNPLTVIGVGLLLVAALVVGLTVRDRIVEHRVRKWSNEAFEKTFERGIGR